MLQHGLGRDREEDFAGEPTGGKACGDDAQHFTAHTRSYHKNPMLDLVKKGWPAAMLHSYRQLFAVTAVLLGTGFSLIAQDSGGPVSIVPRPKAPRKSEVLPKANIRVDTNLVLIPVTVT